jgi:hypothetical protein
MAPAHNPHRPIDSCTLALTLFFISEKSGHANTASSESSLAYRPCSTFVTRKPSSVNVKGSVSRQALWRCSIWAADISLSTGSVLSWNGGGETAELVAGPTSHLSCSRAWAAASVRVTADCCSVKSKTAHTGAHCELPPSMEVSASCPPTACCCC